MIVARDSLLITPPSVISASPEANPCLGEARFSSHGQPHSVTRQLLSLEGPWRVANVRCEVTMTRREMSSSLPRKTSCSFDRSPRTGVVPPMIFRRESY